MEHRSHVDISKINEMLKNQSFEYRDVVMEEFPTSKHSEDGALFNKEVEDGVYDNVKISNEDAVHAKYKKI